MENCLPSNALTASLAVGGLGCFLLLFLLWGCKRRICTSPAGLPLPPGTFGFLCVGETFKHFHALAKGNPRSFLQERTARFRSQTFKTHIFFRKTVVVQGAAANRFIVAAENKQHVLNSWPASMLTVLGEHIPVAKHGAAHHRLRQIMNACLGPAALRRLVDRADAITALHFETCWKGESQLLLLSVIKQNTFRLACNLFAGVEDEALLARISEHFRVWSEGMVSIPVDVPGTAFRRAKRAKQMLVAEMSKLVDSRQEMSADDDEEKHASLLSMLQSARDENGSLLSHEELLDIILFLLFAGYDTSTATLSFVLKYLEQNPDCYHRLLEEHEGIASQKNQEERLTWADIQNMKYTWAVIQETLRLTPIALGGLKEAKVDLSFDGYRIPRGWKIFFSMSPTHDDHQFFPEPSKFNPTRFDVDKIQEGNGLPPYVFIPFGIGPHSCPGGNFARMTMSIYLHHLALRKIRWISIDCNEKIRLVPTLKLAKSYPAKIFFD